MRVVVAEDVMLTREGIVRLLTTPASTWSARRRTPTPAARGPQTRPDAAIVDIRMPPTHTDEGLVAAQQIRAEHPDVGVLVLSQYVEPHYAMRLLEEHPERVGYLLKERVFDVAVLVDALRRLADGETVIDPTIVARLFARDAGADPLAELTAASARCSALVAEGLSNRAIAAPARSSPSGPSKRTSSRSSRSSASTRTPTRTGASSPSSRTCADPAEPLPPSKHLPPRHPGRYRCPSLHEHGPGHSDPRDTASQRSSRLPFRSKPSRPCGSSSGGAQSRTICVPSRHAPGTIATRAESAIRSLTLQTGHHARSRSLAAVTVRSAMGGSGSWTRRGGGRA